jgi:hypothetical protein
MRRIDLYMLELFYRGLHSRYCPLQFRILQVLDLNPTRK